jgi:hypothetical protein
MNPTEIEKMLQNHERRIAILEGHPNKPKFSKAQKTKKSLSDYIIELRDAGFFSQAKTIEEVHKKLQSMYPCAFDRVRIALLHVANRKQLRKMSKIISGKEYKAYVR